MSGTTSLGTAALPSAPAKTRGSRILRAWAPVIVAIAPGPVLTFGVFSVGNYITDHTTVTIGEVSWQVNVSGAPEYFVSCQFTSCPQQVAPGTEYRTSVDISGYFSGKTVRLEAPGPFRLVSTDPTLPTTVPAYGLVVAVVIALPSTAGDYTCLGAVTFG